VLSGACFPVLPPAHREGLAAGSPALQLLPLLWALLQRRAQQEPSCETFPMRRRQNRKARPEAPNPYNTTIEVLGRRSIFFPNIATSVGSAEQQTEVRTFCG